MKDCEANGIEIRWSFGKVGKGNRGGGTLRSAVQVGSTRATGLQQEFGSRLQISTSTQSEYRSLPRTKAGPLQCLSGHMELCAQPCGSEPDYVLVATFNLALVNKLTLLTLSYGLDIYFIKIISETVSLIIYLYLD